MFQKTKAFLYASATLVGYVVGAGIFGLPFVMQRMGYVPAVVLLVILTIFTIINVLSLTEVILRTPGNHFFPGLAGYYFGRKGKIIQLLFTAFSNYGALLAYVVLGSTFLSGFLSNWIPLDGEICLLLFLLAGIILIWHGFEKLGVAEIIMFGILLTIIVAISLVSFGKIEAGHYLNFNAAAAFPAFGVLVFALDGVGGMFPIKQILTRRRHLIKPTIFTSYFFICLIYLAFTAAIIGVFGPAVNQEAIIGIGAALGARLETAALLFGILAVFSSFLVVGTSLKNMFKTDFGIPPLYSWLLVWTIPLSLYYLGFNNFIAIISLIGVVFGVCNTFFINFMLKKARRLHEKKPPFVLGTPFWFNYLIAAIYFVAMVYEIIHVIGISAN